MGVRSFRSVLLGVSLSCLGACGASDEGGGNDAAGLPPFGGTTAPPGPASNAGGSAANPTTSPTPATETTTVNDLAPPPAGAAGAGASTPPAMSGEQTPPAQPTEPVTPEPPPAGATASAGCGVSQGMPANPTLIADPNTIITFPPGYDGSQPFPLLFAFHGANRTNEQMRTIDSRTPGSELENNYVVAFVKSQGTAWDLATDYPRFQRVRDQILAERCIDQSAIFAMGHSSGAQFIVSMLGDSRARETGFAAVTPVSSNLLNNPAWQPVPTLLIHGKMDLERPNDLDGSDDITQYAASNQCTATVQPVDIGTCTSIAAGNATVNPGCVQYDGCAAPTLFCNHDDPNYVDDRGPTNHGWPCFANQEIFTFLQAARL